MVLCKRPPSAARLVAIALLLVVGAVVLKSNGDSPVCELACREVSELREDTLCYHATFCDGWGQRCVSRIQWPQYKVRRYLPALAQPADDRSWLHFEGSGCAGANSGSAHLASETLFATR